MFYHSNRHDRRRAAALERRAQRRQTATQSQQDLLRSYMDDPHNDEMCVGGSWADALWDICRANDIPFEIVEDGDIVVHLKQLTQQQRDVLRDRMPCIMSR